jgi:hypothetical protein
MKIHDLNSVVIDGQLYAVAGRVSNLFTLAA